MGDFAPPQKKPQPATVETARAWSSVPKPKAPAWSPPMQQPMPTSARDIGNTYIEHGTSCDLGTGPACFLSSAQRTRLVDGYQKRVLAAQGTYVLALESLRVDALIEKEEDLSWVLAFVIDVIGLTAIASITKLATLLKAAPALGAVSALHGAGTTIDATVISQAPTAAAAVSEKSIENLVKAAIGVAKTGATATLRAQQNETAQSTKRSSVSYIEVLQGDAASTYQHLREDPVATATDAELVVLFNAFDANEGHTVLAYKTALADKVERFKKSWMRYIGRYDAEHITPVHDRDRAEADRAKSPDDVLDFKLQRGGWTMPTTREIRVAWIRSTSSNTRRLVYVRRDLQDQRFNHGTIDDANAFDDVPHQLEPVEDEFAELAIRRHEQVWGAPPEEIANDDAAWLRMLGRQP